MEVWSGDTRNHHSGVSQCWPAAPWAEQVRTGLLMQGIGWYGPAAACYICSGAACCLCSGLAASRWACRAAEPRLLAVLERGHVHCGQVMACRQVWTSGSGRPQKWRVVMSLPCKHLAWCASRYATHPVPAALVKMPVVIAPLAARSDAAADEFAHGTCRRSDTLLLTARQKLQTDTMHCQTSR